MHVDAPLARAWRIRRDTVKSGTLIDYFTRINLSESSVPLNANSIIYSRNYSSEYQGAGRSLEPVR